MLWRATLAFGLGLGCADLGLLAFATAARLSIVALVVRIAGRTHRPLAEVGLLLAMLACGAMALSTALESAGAFELTTPREAIVEATVCRVGGSLARLDVDLCGSVDVDDPARRLPPRIRLRAPEEPDALEAFDRLTTGHRIRAKLRLLPLRPASNPGARDGRRALQRQGVGARAVLADPALWVRLSSRDEFIWPGRAALAHAFRAKRRDIANRLSHHGEGGGLLRALVLGDRGGLAVEGRADFAALGLAHLLAVSGLHVALVAGAAYALAFEALRRRVRFTAARDSRRAALWFALLCAVLYGALAGWGIPVRRALLFAAVIALGVGLRRSVRPAQALPVAALLLLVAEPHALFEASAQLSFAATAALMLAVERTPHDGVGWIGRFVDAARALIHTSATAIAGTATILSLHGLQVGAAGLVVNLVAVPWTAFVLLPAAIASASIAALFEGELSEAVLTLLAEPARWSLGAVAWAAGWFAAPPRVGKPGLLAVVLSLALVAVVLRVRSTRARVMACLVSILALQFTTTVEVQPAPPRVVFFDVGQGDAILVQGREAAVLVDGGRAVAGRFDQGARVVLPGLRALGVARLDVVVATHADVDHRGGLEAVLLAMPVRELWLPPNWQREPGLVGLAKLARERGARVRNVARGDPVQRFGALELEVLWPRRARRAATRNDDSIVLRARFASDGRTHGSVLLTADIGVASEATLLATGIPLAADVLKVGHHGSRGSSSAAWLRAVGAEHAIVSAPCHGRSGLPSPDAMARLAATSTSIHWTGEVGAVLVGFGPRSDAPVVRRWLEPRGCSISRPTN